MSATKKPLIIASTAESENDFIMLPAQPNDTLIIQTDNAVIRITQPEEDEHGQNCAVTLETDAGDLVAELVLDVLAERPAETIVDFNGTILLEVQGDPNRFKLPGESGGIWISVPFGVVFISQGFDVYDAAYTQVDIYKSTTVEDRPLAHLFV